MSMSQEDIQNLTSWLQTILKEVQEARGASQEMRDDVKLLPEIRDFVSRERGGNSEIDRRLDDTRNHLDSKIDRLEHTLNDLRSEIRDIKSKVDRIKT